MVLQDPRHRNKTFCVDSITDYLTHYGRSLADTVAGIDSEALEKVYAVLEETLKTGGRVLVAGNGGSAAIADHLGCDWMKSTRAKGEPVLRVYSLVSNVPLSSAIANDFGYEQIFAAQLDMLAEPGDLCVLISSSGNSPNIIAAAKKAHEMGIDVVGMTGFDGGELSRLADVNLHVNSANYGIVEDCHQALMHALSQFLALQQDKRAARD